MGTEVTTRTSIVIAIATETAEGKFVVEGTSYRKVISLPEGTTAEEMEGIASEVYTAALNAAAEQTQGVGLSAPAGAGA